MRVAALILRDSSLEPTTVMKRVIHAHADRSETDETLLRRLQVKWRAYSEELLARARKIAEPKPAGDALGDLGLSSEFPKALSKSVGPFEEKVRIAVQSRGWLEFTKSLSAFESRFVEIVRSPSSRT